MNNGTHVKVTIMWYAPLKEIVCGVDNCMIRLDISIPTALTWFGLLLTIVGLALSVVSLVSGNRLANSVKDVQRITAELQTGALKQLMRQQDEAFKEKHLQGTVTVSEAKLPDSFAPIDMSDRR